MCFRIFQGHFIEVQVSDGALYRTKIHCYFLDQTRVVRPLPNEKNYHIFYQMLVGLTAEERGIKRVFYDFHLFYCIIKRTYLFAKHHILIWLSFIPYLFENSQILFIFALIIKIK